MVGIENKISGNVMECLLFLLESPRITDDSRKLLSRNYPSREEYEQDMRVADCLRRFIDEMPVVFLSIMRTGTKKLSMQTRQCAGY